MTRLNSSEREELERLRGIFYACRNYFAPDLMTGQYGKSVAAMLTDHTAWLATRPSPSERETAYWVIKEYPEHRYYLGVASWGRRRSEAIRFTSVADARGVLRGWWWAGQKRFSIVRVVKKKRRAK